MTKYRLKPGWTRAKVMEQFKKYNNGKRALSESSSHVYKGSSCVYKSPDGNRCAVGAFIPDHMSFIFSHHNNDGVADLLARFPELSHYMPFSAVTALKSMQCAHDRSRGQGTYVAMEAWLEQQVEESGVPC